MKIKLIYKIRSDTNFEKHRDSIIEVDNYSVIHKIVFKYKKKFYQTTYDSGITESQEEDPWSNGADVRCDEVREHKVLTSQWLKINK